MTDGIEDRLDRVRQIFLDAVALTASDRAAFLDAQCDGDRGMRAEIEELLSAAVGSEGTGDANLFVQGLLGGIRAAVETCAPDRLIGTRVGRYLITARLSEGGMGAVYEAHQDEPARRVALKTIRFARIGDETTRSRFKREIAHLARLDHPGIAKIYEAGTHDDPAIGLVPYFTMEFVQGAASLTHACEARGLSRADRLHLLAAACDAVHHAHQKGIIHRDLKPSNILVDHAGRPKVIDFGIARALDAEGETVTLDGTTPGTPEYMSPEQCDLASNEVDVRSDVFSLGVVLFSLLSGRLPFDFPADASASTKIAIVRNTTPKRLSAVVPSLKGDLDAITDRALAIDPNDRYQSANEFAADIRRHLNHEPTVARPLTLPERAARLVIRKPWQSLGASLIGALALTTVVLLQTTRDRRLAEDRAQASRLTADLADKAADRARREAQRAEASEYNRALLMAEVALRENDAPGAERILSEHLSAGWEHAHLQNRVGTSTGEVKGFDQPVVDIAVNPNGKVVAAVPKGATSIWLFDAARLAHERLSLSQALSVIRLMGRTCGIGFSSDGTSLWCAENSASGLSCGVEVIDVTDPCCPKRGPVVAMQGIVKSAAADFQAAKIALGFNDGAIRVLRVGSPSPPIDVDRGPAQPTTLAFCPNGSRLCLADERHQIRLYDIADPAHPRCTLEALVHFHNVEEVAWNRGSSRLATASGDMSVRILDAFASEGRQSATEICQLLHSSGIQSVDFGPALGFDDGRYAVITGAADRLVSFWDVREHVPFACFPTSSGVPRPLQTRFGGHEGPVRRVRMSADHRTIYSASDDMSVRAWPACAIEPVFAIDVRETSVVAASFSPDGSRVCSMDANGRMAVWRVETGLGSSPIAVGLQASEGSCAWHPHLPVVACATKDGAITLWDLRIDSQPQCIRVLSRGGDDPLCVNAAPKVRHPGALAGAGRKVRRRWQCPAPGSWWI